MFIQQKIRIPLDGLPPDCQCCGEMPETWPLTVFGGVLNVTCPACFAIVAPVVVTSAEPADECEGAPGGAVHDWGTLTDYATGGELRPATRAEWERTVEVTESGAPGAYTGAWEDENGLAVYVAGGPES